MTAQDEEWSGPASSGEGLRRLHPLTPLLRSWRMVGLAVAIGLSQFRDDLDRFRFFWDALRGDAELSVLVRALAILLVVALVAVLAAFLSWRATGFAIVDDGHGVGTLRFHRGLVVRQRRRVRLDRVQSVDVEQPVFARLLGLAVLRLDVAAGGDASVSLAYLSKDDAWSWRAEILRHTTNAAERGSFEGDRPDDELIAQVSTGRLVRSSLLEAGGTLAFFAVWVIGLVVVGALWGGAALLAGLSGVIAVTLAIVVQLRKQVASILRDADFRLYRTATGIRISAGLTSTVNRTVDTDRIQGIRLEEPWLWRRLGWARVEVDVAGTAATTAARLMPVADRPAAIALVRSVVGVDLDAGDVRRAGRRVRVLEPLGGRHLGVVLHEHGAVSIRGRWRRVRFYVPYARTQSVSVVQGPVQRRLQLASAYLDMPKGADRWHARHRDATEAAELVRELAARARTHRLPLRRTVGDGARPQLAAPIPPKGSVAPPGTGTAGGITTPVGATGLRTGLPHAPDPGA